MLHSKVCRFQTASFIGGCNPKNRRLQQILNSGLFFAVFSVFPFLADFDWWGSGLVVLVGYNSFNCKTFVGLYRH